MRAIVHIPLFIMYISFSPVGKLFSSLFFATLYIHSVSPHGRPEIAAEVQPALRKEGSFIKIIGELDINTMQYSLFE